MFLNIECERLRHRISKEEMALKLDVSTTMLDNWINGHRPIPANKLRALSLLFGGISLDYLLQNF